MLRNLVAALALLLPAQLIEAQAPGQAPASPLTVFLVRHAEKGPENPDPSLTPQGRQRAEALARVLGDSRVSAAFVSEFKRTQETVAPLAAAAGLTTVAIPAAAMDSLVLRLRGLPPGSRAVVASHSNLIHLIVEKLSGIKLPPLTEADYDRLVVVTVLDGKVEVVVLRYGER